MAPASFTLRERFHLLLIRQLAVRFAGRAWAVKGGICLRFYHRSARLSEDLDCDMAVTIRRETVRTGVEATLDNKPFAASLADAGVQSLLVRTGKQTETTQRWKITLAVAGGGFLHTKLEISRRHGRVSASAGVPGSDILLLHACPPFAAPHYDASAMALQKTLALAAPARHAPRDMFDLDHLIVHCGVEAEALRHAAGHAATTAADKTAAFSVADFQKEVVPFLTDELMAAYRHPQAFRDLQRRVVTALRGG